MELLRITLDEAKIRAACEAFVAHRLKPDEQARATLDGAEVTVVISKKRVRKAKGAAA